LVDSGADSSILPISYASYLGIDLAACERIPCMTAGGTGFVLVHAIALEAELEAMNARFAMKSAFTEHGDTILLGREDFFSQFRVVIDEAEQTVTLERP
jgi:hypothetical protein